MDKGFLRGFSFEPPTTLRAPLAELPQGAKRKFDLVGVHFIISDIKLIFMRW